MDSWVGKIHWRRERLPTPVFWPGESRDCVVHGVAKSQTRLSDLQFQFTFVLKRVVESESDAGYLP